MAAFLLGLFFPPIWQSLFSVRVFILTTLNVNIIRFKSIILLFVLFFTCPTCSFFSFPYLYAYFGLIECSLWFPISLVTLFAINFCFWISVVYLSGGGVCVHKRALMCIQLFATPWTVAHQTPLSMRFPRQEYWCRLPFASSGDLPLPRDQTCVSCVSCIGSRILCH